ncbi:HypC/HybG/HupF family hydrogenase formation chaperone [Vibrio hangzhouensis]|uniref:HypC/HybG/HupF family hydrogenase formation chaperone n=1 Tax=Vibrio hangzhouensis TaxID=462991 RepID=UPI001C98B290|nr:HypC/HybG/HupF family hydrogenase formation chaperone [Vibrio hangzhouensis]MBY6196422.1 HypC/HybG/HupF family hydrogenase formation chaperone [Vibrio hangzhouensis]
MCLGLPGKVIEITNSEEYLGLVDVGGVVREVNLNCVAHRHPESLINCWVLIHVGFAMCLIDEQQARKTLEILDEMQATESRADDDH